MAITANTRIRNGAVNNGTITANKVIIDNGGYNAGTITASVTIASGGVNLNSGTITGATTVAGGALNTGTINGNVVLEGTNTSQGTINGNVQINSGGLSAGAIVGNVQINDGASVSGSIQGTAVVKSGGELSSGSTVSGTAYVAAGAIYNGSAATAIVTTVTNGVASVTTTTGGTTIGFTGPAFNLQGDNKAYSYSNGANTGEYTGTVVNLEGDGKTYNYLNGVNTGEATDTHGDGYYVDGYYSGGVKVAAPTSTPQTTVDGASGVYYTYSTSAAGAGTLASGAYTNYYLGSDSKINTSYNASAPESTVEVIDGKAIYCTYTSGVASAATGAYMYVYLNHDGTLADTYTNSEPQVTQTTIEFGEGAGQPAYAWYYNGIGTVAVGAFSNGYFYYTGHPYTGYTNAVPEQSPSDSKWYYFTNGSANAASGAFSSSYFLNGDKSWNFASATPIQAQDDSKYYTYALAGTATLNINNALTSAGMQAGVSLGCLTHSPSYGSDGLGVDLQTGDLIKLGFFDAAGNVGAYPSRITVANKSTTMPLTYAAAASSDAEYIAYCKDGLGNWDVIRANDAGSFQVIASSANPAGMPYTDGRNVYITGYVGGQFVISDGVSVHVMNRNFEHVATLADNAASITAIHYSDVTGYLYIAFDDHTQQTIYAYDTNFNTVGGCNIDTAATSLSSYILHSVSGDTHYVLVNGVSLAQTDNSGGTYQPNVLANPSQESYSYASRTAFDAILLLKNDGVTLQKYGYLNTVTTQTAAGYYTNGFFTSGEINTVSGNDGLYKAKDTAKYYCVYSGGAATAATGTLSDSVNGKLGIYLNGYRLNWFNGVVGALPDAIYEYVNGENMGVLYETSIGGPYYTRASSGMDISGLFVHQAPNTGNGSEWTVLAANAELTVNGNPYAIGADGLAVKYYTLTTNLMTPLYALDAAALTDPNRIMLYTDKPCTVPATGLNYATWFTVNNGTNSGTFYPVSAEIGDAGLWGVYSSYFNNIYYLAIGIATSLDANGFGIYQNQAYGGSGVPLSVGTYYHNYLDGANSWYVVSQDGGGNISWSYPGDGYYTNGYYAGGELSRTTSLYDGEMHRTLDDGGIYFFNWDGTGSGSAVISIVTGFHLYDINPGAGRGPLMCDFGSGILHNNNPSLLTGVHYDAAKQRWYDYGEVYVGTNNPTPQTGWNGDTNVTKYVYDGYVTNTADLNGASVFDEPTTDTTNSYQHSDCDYSHVNSNGGYRLWIPPYGTPSSYDYLVLGPGRTGLLDNWNTPAITDSYITSTEFSVNSYGVCSGYISEEGNTKMIYNSGRLVRKEILHHTYEEGGATMMHYAEITDYRYYVADGVDHAISEADCVAIWMDGGTAQGSARTGKTVRMESCTGVYDYVNNYYSTPMSGWTTVYTAS